MKLAQKAKHSEKNLPLSTANPTQPGLELSLGHCGDTLTTNHLSCGITLKVFTFYHTDCTYLK